MKLLINGEPVETDSDMNLQKLVDEYNREGTPVAVAINGHFVPKGNYGDFALDEGDEIELLSPMMGG